MGAPTGLPPLVMRNSSFSGASLVGAPSDPPSANASRCGTPALENAGLLSKIASRADGVLDFAIPPVLVLLPAPVWVDELEPQPARTAAPARPAPPRRIARRDNAAGSG